MSSLCQLVSSICKIHLNNLLSRTGVHTLNNHNITNTTNTQAQQRNTANANKIILSGNYNIQNNLGSLSFPIYARSNLGSAVYIKKIHKI